MRILFVSEYFHPRKNGGEVWAWELCQALAKKHEVTVLTTRHDDSPEEEVLDSVRILRPVRSGRTRPGRWLAARRLAKRLWDLMRELEPEIVHTMAYTVNVKVTRYARAQGIPCVTSIHSFFGPMWSRISFLGPFYAWLEKRTIVKDTSNELHVPSEYTAGLVAEATGRKPVVIHNWTRKKFPKAKKHKTWLFVGSLERVKQPVSVVVAAEGRKLTIIGTGSQKSRVVRTAEEHNVKLDLKEDVPREEVLQYIGGASLVLVPSLSESFSLVALESVAQGTPVSGTKVGIIPELPHADFPPEKTPRRVPKRTQKRLRNRFSLDKKAKDFERLYRKTQKEARILDVDLE